MSTPSKVKSAHGRVPGGSSSASVSLGSAPASGNLLVAFVGADKNSGGYSISGFTNALDITGSSTSLHVMWKISAGTETSVTFTRTGGNSPSGDTLWYAEYSQTGVGSFVVCSSASTPYSDSNTRTRSTNTARNALYDGLAFGAWAVDTYDSIGIASYTNGYTEQHGYFDHTGPLGTAGLLVATDPVSIAGNTSCTMSYEWGTADQIAGGVVVFGRSSAVSNTVAAVKATATGQAIVPYVRGTSSFVYPTPATATAQALAPSVDYLRPYNPTDLQAHICVGPNDVVPRWRDISPWLLLDDEYEIEIVRGRSDELSSVEAGTAQFTLDNSNGDFTPDNAAATFYPYCTTDTLVRLRFPDYKGNYVPAQDADLEGSGVGGWLGFFGSATLANSTTRAKFGTHSLQVTWASSGPLAFTYAKGLVAGRTYTVSCWVYVPAGQPAAILSSFDWSGNATSTITGAWQQLAVTFTLPTNHSRADGVMIGIGWSGGTGGQSIWVDGIMVNEGPYVALDFTTTQADPTYRFTGAVTSWMEEWPGGSDFCVVRVGASDRVAELGRHTFNSLPVEELKLRNPLVIFPLDDAAESEAATDASGGGTLSASMGTRGTGGGDSTNGIAALTFGSEGPDGGSGRTAAAFYSGSGSTDHTYLKASWDADPQGALGWAEDRTLVCAFKVKTAQAGIMLRLESSQSNAYELGMDASGHVYAKQVNGSASLWSATTTSTYADNQWHSAVVTIKHSTSSIEVYVDDTNAASTTYSGFVYGVENRNAYIGGHPKGLGLRGSLAFATVLPGTVPTAGEIAEISAAIRNGHINDSSDTRAARYLTYAGIPDADMVLDSGRERYMARVDLYDNSAWTALSTVNETEGGAIFARRDNKLALRERYATVNNTVALTVDQTGVGKDTKIGVDNQLYANRCVGTSEVVGKYTAEDATDIAKRGVYQRGINVATTDLASLKARTEWVVMRNSGDPKPRFPGVVVDLATQEPAVVTAALALDVTSWLQVTDLDTTAPSATVTQAVDGYTEYISLNRWRLELTTSPAVDFTVIVLDDPTKGTLDGENVLGY